MKYVSCIYYIDCRQEKINMEKVVRALDPNRDGIITVSAIQSFGVGDRRLSVFKQDALLSVEEDPSQESKDDAVGMKDSNSIDALDKSNTVTLQRSNHNSIHIIPEKTGDVIESDEEIEFPEELYPDYHD